MHSSRAASSISRLLSGSIGPEIGFSRFLQAAKLNAIAAIKRAIQLRLIFGSPWNAAIIRK